MALDQFHLAYFSASGPVLAVEVQAPRALVPLAVAETFIDVREATQAQRLEAGSPEFVRYDRIAEEVRFVVGVPTDRLPSANRSNGASSGFPSGHAGVARHAGDHEHALDEFRELEEWIVAQGLTPSGPPFEFHWTRAEDGYDSGTWETSLVWFVEEHLPLPAD